MLFRSGAGSRSRQWRRRRPWVSKQAEDVVDMADAELFPSEEVVQDSVEQGSGEPGRHEPHEAVGVAQHHGCIGCVPDSSLGPVAVRQHHGGRIWLMERIRASSAVQLDEADSKREVVAGSAEIALGLGLGEVAEVEDHEDDERGAGPARDVDVRGLKNRSSDMCIVGVNRAPLNRAALVYICRLITGGIYGWLYNPKPYVLQVRVLIQYIVYHDDQPGMKIRLLLHVKMLQYFG